MLNMLTLINQIVVFLSNKRIIVSIYKHLLICSRFENEFTQESNLSCDRSIQTEIQSNTKFCKMISMRSIHVYPTQILTKLNDYVSMIHHF